jgi:hypothetical protein
LAELIFDLLGDPVPPDHEGPGRPPHVPDDRKRNKIILLLAMGWNTKRIAAEMGLDQKTLRKHYSHQLRARDVALDRLRAGRLSILWEAAQQGKVAALKEIGKEIARIEAATFGNAVASDDRRPAKPRPTALGKKEAARIAAASAGMGSDWGEDLLPPTVN